MDRMWHVELNVKDKAVCSIKIRQFDVQCLTDAKKTNKHTKHYLSRILWPKIIQALHINR